MAGLDHRDFRHHLLLLSSAVLGSDDAVGVLIEGTKHNMSSPHARSQDTIIDGGSISAA
jgi:hypothetical protein